MASHRKQFYAVTESGSVYLANISCQENVFLEKVDSCFPQKKGLEKGSRIGGGTMIAIARQLYLFIPEGGGYGSTFQREIALVNTRYWGGNTSQVVGLFDTVDQAMACGEVKYFTPCDERWKEHTVQVLRSIGTDHPHCAISCSSSLWLMPPGDWQARQVADTT